MRIWLGFGPGLALALAAAFVGCSDAPLGEPAALESPRYNEVWQISTHNSYWVDRAIVSDLFASGTQERLIDQLLFDHVRALEIDIHPDPANDGKFLVFHTVAGDALCATLEDCLAELRAFHRAIPEHEVVNVSIELKGIVASTWDPRHTPEDLDRALRLGLGDRLLTPGEILAGCDAHPAAPAPPSGESLSDCIARAGWPTIAELRGRFIVSLLGNWDEIGDAQCTRDWVTYAAGADIHQRAAFPMGSSWKLDWSALSPRLQGLVPPDELARAVSQSAFLQIEDLADPRIDPFLARRGVIRVDGAFSADDQLARTARGMQLLQTDFPWTQADERGPAQPFRALLGGVDQRATTEPGDRLLLDGPGDERVFAFVRAPADSTTRWEATVASGSAALRFGCLRAAVDSAGGPIDSVEVCRGKHPRDEHADPEGLILRLQVCRDGSCASLDVPADLQSRARDLLALSVVNQRRGPSCATAFAALDVGADFGVTWRPLGEPICFAAPLAAQGVARVADGQAGAVLFGGTRFGDAARLRALRAGEIDGVVAASPEVPGEGRPEPQRLVDLSYP